MSDNITREPYRNAWYKQLSDAVKKHDEEIAEMTPHLVPDVEEGDNGKILIAGEEGAFDWGQPPEELPIITEGDEGKVLKVNEGVPKWLEDQDAEIPSHTASDEGKMLSVNAQNALEWKDVPDELPEATSADAGKVLSVDSNGSPEWAAPLGGDNKFKFYHGTYNSSNRGVNASNSVTPQQISDDIHNGYVPVITYNYDTDIMGSIFITRCGAFIEGYSILSTTESGGPTYLIEYSARGSLYLNASKVCYIPPISNFPSLPADGKYLLVANVSNYQVTYAWERQP